jgi:hypothetical protein
VWLVGCINFYYVKIKEGYELAFYPLYIEVRCASKWYPRVKLHILPRRLIGRLSTVRRFDKVLGRRITEFDEDVEALSVK